MWSVLGICKKKTPTWLKKHCGCGMCNQSQVDNRMGKFITGKFAAVVFYCYFWSIFFWVNIWIIRLNAYTITSVQLNSNGQIFKRGMLMIGRAAWKIDVTNQTHHPDLGSNASSVWNFCAPFSDVISRENQRRALWIFGCFLKLPQS